jgi:6-phosphofructokinase 1
MNIAVAQSGGPTCAINASLVGVFNEALKTEKIDAVFGSINGIEGIIRDNLVNLKTMINTNEDIELLCQTPSTVLGSCRYKLCDYKEDDTDYKKIHACLENRRIGIFLYIGGNDSMDTVMKLSDYLKMVKSDIKVIGIPKTIDNDLCITDHTPGFGSAAKYVATTLQEIIRDSSVYSLKSVTIVEIMGRHAGWLTASTCVLRANGEEAPHLIYLPESEFTLEKFIEDIKQQQSKHKAVIVAVSEGIKLPTDICEQSVSPTDSFGHVILGGVGKQLENILKKELGCKVRSIELNVMQRCSSHLLAKTDIDESIEIGAMGVRAGLAGETGKVMVFRRINDAPYTVIIEPHKAKDIANKEKTFPKEWITPQGNDIKNDAIKYFLPLIQGERITIKKNGLPQHFKIQEAILK